MPSEITYDILQLLMDRYDPLELFELLNIPMEELVEAFDARISDKINDGTIDIGLGQ